MKLEIGRSGWSSTLTKTRGGSHGDRGDRVKMARRREEDGYMFFLGEINRRSTLQSGSNYKVQCVEIERRGTKVKLE